MNVLNFYRHILYTETNLITLVSCLQRCVENVRKSRKMPAQLGLTVVSGMMLVCLCITLSVVFL